MWDLAALQIHLARADIHIARGEERLRRLMARVERLRAMQLEAGRSQTLLRQVDQSLAAWKEHRAALLRMKTRLDHPERSHFEGPMPHDQTSPI